jgi:hypothetical protein
LQYFTIITSLHNYMAFVQCQLERFRYSHAPSKSRVKRAMPLTLIQSKRYMASLPLLLCDFQCALSRARVSFSAPPAPRSGPSFWGSISAGTSFSICHTVSSSGPFQRSSVHSSGTIAICSPTSAGSSSTSCPPILARRRAGRSAEPWSAATAVFLPRPWNLE